MRIAVSGSHRVGKTTLAVALVEALPRYAFVPEPYRLLEEDGHTFAEMPSIADFELQLERSIQCIRESGPNTIFDRCPLDILGYLMTHQDAESFRLEDWLLSIQESVSELDLVVFVPIEDPDRIAVPRSEVGLRAEVDAVLHDLIVDDAYGLGFDMVSVSGSLAERKAQALSGLG